MKRIMKSLPARLILGVIIGIAAGLAANEAFMNIVVTVKYILGELIILLAYRLIIIGFHRRRPLPSWGTMLPACWAWLL